MDISLWNYMSFARSHQRRIQTASGLKRINKELKGTSKAVEAFPSYEQFMRLGASILIDLNEEWIDC